MHMRAITKAASRVGADADLGGLLGGTTILTLEGEMPVEDLREGCRVITRDGGMAVLRRIHRKTTRMEPVRILAGSLGHTRPDRDMLVAPGALLHIRDWRAEALYGAPTAAIAARDLVDGEFLRVCAPREVTVFSLAFDRQHILYADGVEILSAPV